MSESILLPLRCSSETKRTLKASSTSLRSSWYVEPAVN